MKSLRVPTALTEVHGLPWGEVSDFFNLFSSPGGLQHLARMHRYLLCFSGMLNRGQGCPCSASGSGGCRRRSRLGSKSLKRCRRGCMCFSCSLAGALGSGRESGGLSKAFPCAYLLRLWHRGGCNQSYSCPSRDSDAWS